MMPYHELHAVKSGWSSAGLNMHGLIAQTHESAPDLSPAKHDRSHIGGCICSAPMPSNATEPSVAVVIPVYKPSMTRYERIAFNRCLEILKGHQLAMVAPEGLSLAQYEINQHAIVRRFSSRFFAGIRGYNHMLLSQKFYSSFMDFDYILIYQLDAFVFRDELAYWCSLGYDYIGAPWLDGLSVRGLPHRGAGLLARIAPFWNLPTSVFVGNGGLSLRKVAPCLELVRRLVWHVRFWRANEDAFFALHAAKHKSLSIPDPKTAVKFAFEKDPRRCFSLSGERLPFGCHGWAKWNIEFWRPIFAELGYNI